MCEPKPYPRCADHARKNLQRAERSGDPSAIKQATAEWQMTRAYTTELRATAERDYRNALKGIEALSPEEATKRQKNADNARSKKLARAAHLDRKRAEQRAYARRYFQHLAFVRDPASPLPTVSLILENPNEAVEVRLEAAKALHNRVGIFGTFTVPQVAGIFGLNTGGA